MGANESEPAAREIADAWARTLRGIRDAQLQIGQVRAQLERLGPARAADVLTIVLARAEQREEPFAVLLLRTSLALLAPELAALKDATARVARARGQLALARFLGAELEDSPAGADAGPEVKVHDLGPTGPFTQGARPAGVPAEQAPGAAQGLAAERPHGHAGRPEPTPPVGAEVRGAEGLALDPALARALEQQRGRPLSLGERKSLARKRDKNLLARVLRDPHPDVVRILLDNPALTELDVVRLCARRPNRPDALAEVFRHPRWICRYRVRRALALNPYTPEPLALQLLPHLTPADLKAVASSGDVSERVRAACSIPRQRPLH